jgi:AraC-like DNA-binding protein
VDLAWVSLGGFQVSRGRLRAPTAHLPIRGRFSYRCSGRAFDVLRGGLVYFEPGEIVEIAADGGEYLSISLRGGARGRETATPGRTPVRGTTEVPLDTEGRTSLAAALGALASVRDPSPCGIRTCDRERLEGRLANVVAGLVERELGEDGRHPDTSRKVRLLEEWVDAHLAEPLSLERLCAVAGASERSLRRWFVARRGVAPLAHVVSRRLAAARMRLALAGPEESVTRVALDCGFSHLGRFAGAYRESYGESPNRTLQRAIQDGSRPAGATAAACFRTTEGRAVADFG